ncbi:hypothetical protein OH76DRAFT_889821 [Lentinus brumalis]|uniref:Uncharacterized protein n=1 Tax=Lentinus brumalis TaxID=2498619 RepID=A0A371D106_9APHY|nr:hypothetical protein OH76DRAFT_889821 [Polyporus brumalis]
MQQSIYRIAPALGDLTHLGIDYSPDSQEDQLLQHFVDSYPHLTSLELHRIGDTPLAWPEDTPTMVNACYCHLPRYTDPDTTFVTRALSLLRHLDAVRLNLNMTNSGAQTYGRNREFFAWLRARSLGIAKTITPMLGPSVTLLSLLVPAPVGARWIEYGVSATQCVVSQTANSAVRQRD